MKAQAFSYIRGELETNTPWYPPDPEFLNAWRDEFFAIEGVDHYTYWLCGAVLESWPTQDVDILITGSVIDYQHLEHVMVNAMRLGFKHRQLIDIAWNDYYKKYLERGRCERRAICCDHYYQHGWCSLEHCTAQARQIETIVVGNEIIKNGLEITPPDPYAVRLSKYLWKIQMDSPSERQIQRMLEGKVYTQSPIILRPDLDFKDYVNWP
ncbi:hypothetical protein Lqui_0834 [Legionella quinlivanii]|uniref:Uncharacterized protein n=1 Tax=Legionella quinlivanii TaxID=45073 RepID=A0A0W0Y5R2_9GAMM|nr:hypothetical protein [Legionella quinlivanii]KTD51990.1 hypothetical protein Lqui_0834 [Legionella quinlivanii]MCW8452253.1 hypothetical protein [Legionella quinlivanii]SEF86820.1 hypothetical protein SAMN02746093_01295 [Legionella quinlivanii DSM 21216]STY12515.1 Uncharacterised protein [Legionella quinlivanii]